MPQIIDKPVRLAYPLGHHLHLLIAQIPNRIAHSRDGWRIADRQGQWDTIRSVLDLVGARRGNVKRMHFLLFPESVLPVERLDEVLGTIEAAFPANSVTMIGVEHVRLRVYRNMLERFRHDNEEAIALVDRDIDSGDVLDVPVNWCVVAVKEHDGRLRVFLEAKSHPWRGEEFLDMSEDLYRGRHFYFFRNELTPFNFMALVCLDYVYRSLYASNVRQIIDHANRLFFRTRQWLDVLFVLQSNPKPEHRAYRDVLSGFYGEYLEDTPGVRETITVFGNCSEESVLADVGPGEGCGASSIVIGRHHRLGHASHDEFSTDDFGGAPLWRLRFGRGTRLYYLNLPLHHQVDPRATRVPLKVHWILRRTPEGAWTPVRAGGEPGERRERVEVEAPEVGTVVRH
jgi:hypothetical protein